MVEIQKDMEFNKQSESRVRQLHNGSWSGPNLSPPEARSPARRGSQTTRKPFLRCSHVTHRRLLISFAVTPHEYKQAIYVHSQRSIVSSSFPGGNYLGFADWLIRPHQSSRTGPSTQEGGNKHWLATLHNLDGHGSQRTWLLAESEASTLTTVPKPHLGNGHLLFYRGHLSPSWIAELGSAYRIDPEFFCRHLDFFDTSVYRSGFHTPSLISTTNNIIHIYVNTIFPNASTYSRAYDDSSHQGSIRDDMARYRKQLQNSACCGDSLVREYTVLSDHYAVMEQRISICIAQNGDGWIGLVLMDHGHDLDSSPTGPWTSDKTRKYSTGMAALPIIQHHPKMIFRKVGNVDKYTRLPSDKAISRDTTAHAGLPQSTSTLPLEYPSLLSALDLMKHAKTNPLCALVPVFAHAAFSEVAFLNLVTELIADLTKPDSLDSFRSHTFESLQTYEVVLRRHKDHLQHVLRSIRTLSEKTPFIPWQHPPPPSPTAERRRSSDANTDKHHSSLPDLLHSSSFSAVGIVADYEDLLDRCSGLLSRIESAKSSEMNRTMILESRRAIEQSERMKHLTQLATYFIPLTFTASLFGMNFGVLGQGKLPVWWYVVLAIPLTLLTHVVYSWGRMRSWVKVKLRRRKPIDGVIKPEF